MLDAIFQGIFDTEMTRTIAPGDFLLCIAVSLMLGAVLSLAYMYRTRYTKSFVITLAILPAVVCVVIMMVNGNIGTGVAVAGAFSLVRFRSAPGSAREIGTIFLAMGTGLIAGMGYLGYAALFTVLLSAVFMLYNRLAEDKPGAAAKYKIFKITVPEDLDYTGVFEEVFAAFDARAELIGVKTIHMGSLFRLTFSVKLGDARREKELIDALRVRNGNLEIGVSRDVPAGTEL